MALETERITSQSQARTYFNAPVHNFEEKADKELLSVPKTKVVKDQGVVTLQTEGDISSSENEIEMERLPTTAITAVVKKRVYEEIGENTLAFLKHHVKSYLSL